MSFIFKKSGTHHLEATSDESLQFLKSCKLGQDILVTPKRPRNYEFHKKIFALVKWAYLNVDHPTRFHDGAIVTMDIDTFRSNLIVMSGFYTPIVSFNGNMTFKPDSLQYEKCNPAKASRIYSEMLDVISIKLYQGNYSTEKLEQLSSQYLNFC